MALLGGVVGEEDEGEAEEEGEGASVMLEESDIPPINTALAGDGGGKSGGDGGDNGGGGKIVDGCLVAVGWVVGVPVGEAEGMYVDPSTVGASVGVAVGLKVGGDVGLVVGGSVGEEVGI
ncbi:hypothetical protein CYMTET_27527 [Cymbomonas tetramitiformis]|uniref:Uncharacterized protein n=1 Tax=Cymbomonas tetramitiformis TaxID=36881 RepID=A0AAE0FQ20_9CHLO|nr:hypothetical protein CYMTET_27527 [Cymbomonas tetramitiformis]